MQRHIIVLYELIYKQAFIIREQVSVDQALK